MPYCFDPSAAVAVVNNDPYESCPVFENARYRLRLVNMDDAVDLLTVYSDPAVWPLLNSDNCNSDFHFTTVDEMAGYIRAWLDEYAKRYYIRFSIIDRTCEKAIGTIELFSREAEDFFTDCGMLRLDLHRTHENVSAVTDILQLLLPHTFSLFHCHMIATKVPPIATERQKALKRLGFTVTNEMLVGGHDGKRYGDYFVLFTS